MNKLSIEDLIDEIGSKPTCFSIIVIIAAFAQNSVITFTICVVWLFRLNIAIHINYNSHKLR